MRYSFFYRAFIVSVAIISLPTPLFNWIRCSSLLCFGVAMGSFRGISYVCVMILLLFFAMCMRVDPAEIDSYMW
jgi:hypothetical protein